MVDEQVPATLLDTPIDLSPPEDPSSTSDAVEAIIEALAASSNPAVFVDCLVQRHDALPELKNLVDQLQLPIYASNMGKSLVDEDHKNYVGIYNGSVSAPGLCEAFEKSDLVLVLGSLPSDTNTGGFGRKISPDKCIDVAPFEVNVSLDRSLPYTPSHIVSR